MILIDFSQVIIAPAMFHHQKTRETLTDDLIRHIVITKVMDFKKRLNRYSKDVVLCFDGRGYWRNKEFEYYKQNRKKSRDKSTFDWDQFYKSFNKIKAEFKEYMPMKCVEVSSAEADDVIAVLARSYYDKYENIIIVSVDKDFLQLREFLGPKIRQWSPTEKAFIKKFDYDYFTHIIKGDSSDGIPNIFSDDDVFVTDKRSKPVKKTLIEELRTLDEDELRQRLGEHYTKFERNTKLINLLYTPEDVRDEIIHTFEHQPIKKSLMTYLTKHRLRKVMEQTNF